MPFHPKIPRYQTREGQEVLNQKEYYIQEKLDGSQFSFYINENAELICRSKNCIIDLDNPGGNFKPIVDYLISIKERITEVLPYNLELFGETLAKPRHNTLEYQRVPRNHLAVFGARHYDKWLDLAALYLRNYHGSLELEFIDFQLYQNDRPYGSQGLPGSCPSMLGGEIEGYILKSFTKDGEMFVAKHVMPSFSEVNKANHGEVKVPKNASDFDVVMCTYLNNLYLKNRYIKALNRLKEDNVGIIGDSKDIPLLCKEVVRDLIEEEQENIKDDFWRIAEKHIKKKAVKHLAEWYINFLEDENVINTKDV